MAVLGGLVAPQFLKYIGENHAKACKTDRESILAVYERCVYAGELDVEQDDLDSLLDGSYAKYKSEMESLKKCPKGGTYTGKIEGTKAYVICSEGNHDDIAMVDFAGWKNEEETETADDPIAVPTPTPTPIITATPTPSPTATPTSTPVTRGKIWPYDDDLRWDAIGRVPGSKLFITVPTPLFQGKDGTWYVVVNRNNDGSNKYGVNYEWSGGPELGQSGSSQGHEDVITWSGRIVTEPEFLNAGQITNVNYGDIYVCDGKQYIFNGFWGHTANWPIKDKESGFYLVGDAATYE